MLKITEYADKLIDDLDKVDYLDLERLYPGIMFITKGEERVGAVVGRIDYDDQLDYCTSGDYLYWAEDCYVKRINIQEILDSLGL